jgi:hypothetical protein
VCFLLTVTPQIKQFRIAYDFNYHMHVVFDAASSEVRIPKLAQPADGVTVFTGQSKKPV